MPFFVHGLDLGQEQDHTAHVVLEVAGTWSKLEYTGLEPELRLPQTKLLHIEALPITRMDARHIQRYPLGTKYRAIYEDMKTKLVGTPRPRYFCVDRTGVGIGVCEIFESLSPIGITITSGKDMRFVNEQNIHVPKVDLVAVVQSLLQNRQLRLSDRLEHTALLAKELAAFRYKMSTGHVSYEAGREKDHDDLVLATAIAAWFGKQVLIQNQAAAEAKIQQEQEAMQEHGASISPY